MIPLPLYVGAPAILGLLLIIALRYTRVKLTAPAVVWSYRLAWAQLGVAAVSVMLTTRDPISGVACATGLYGFYTSVMLAALDSASLLWWFVGALRLQGAVDILRPALFIALRMLVHAALAGAFLWCAMLCTV